MTRRLSLSEIETFLAENPQTERIELLFPDINGIFRGKWLPPDAADKLAEGKVRLPVSTYALDIAGEDVSATGLAIERGDPDGYGWPVTGTLVPKSWAPNPAAQVLMTMTEADGSACVYDPRVQLANIVARFEAMELTPVVATELEFYIYQPQEDAGAAPIPPAGLEGAQAYDLSAVSSLEPCLRDIQDGCAEQGIGSDVLIAEFGPGQFEINFHHVPDALSAADQAMLFKRLVRGVARNHGLAATFMAKPYGGGEIGSGMHAHVSLLDRDGRNIFDAEQGIAAKLRHAVGGILSTMRPLQAIFAPHGNSYRRFQPGSYAPTQTSWGLDHRGVAVRLPETSGPGARLEHRICGADVNPYLALTGILGGILIGLEDEIDCGPEIEQGGTGVRLHHDWLSAVDEFVASPIPPRVFSPDFCRCYAAMRHAEVERLTAEVSDVEYRMYLRKL